MNFSVSNETFSTQHVNATTLPNVVSSTTNITVEPATGSMLPTITEPVTFLQTTLPHQQNNSIQNESQCLWILYEDIGNSRVRIWDVVLFIPNLIFLIFVLYRLRRVWHRILSGIGSGGSPIFVTYFTLVALSALLAVIRGIVSMTVDVATTSGSDANKILWVILRFFLLMAEMSVLVFGIAFGHLDSKSSIKRVLFVTTSLALIYSIVQGTMEMLETDPRFQIETKHWSVYGHGGSLFCFVTSAIFLIMYVFVGCLPFVNWLQKYLSVPTRKSFYVYVGFMAVLNLLAVVGCGLLLEWNWIGLCLLDGYSLAYFTMFAPLVYWTFLSSYFGTAQPSSMLFSYATHVDESQNDITDFDMPATGGNVDSTLSGILVFDHGDTAGYQVPNGHIEEPLHNFTDGSSDLISPSVDSTHSFFHSNA
uniref:Integral membrane protein GPR175 n=1 Tax=Phallusia mammillata TaxID=59560 RepID=A0A6F9DW43_9ASCI|nr:transmembrane protein adipocyte-associated 1-like [Phallusia mammillata]